MEIEIFTKRLIFNILLKRSGGKNPSEAGRPDSYGNSGFSIKILTDVCFAYKEKEIQHRCSLSYKLDRIRFLFF